MKIRCYHLQGFEKLTESWDGIELKEGEQLQTCKAEQTTLASKLPSSQLIIHCKKTTGNVKRQL